MLTKRSKELRKLARDTKMNHQLGKTTREETRSLMDKVLSEIKTLNKV